jgi:uncharacterized protein YdeI (YjbR/CyaY-like superfamily)
MGTRDPRVDQYIEKAKAFAQPILRQFREVVHESCPQVEETIRWSVPSYSYRGMLCNTAAFKAHCAIVFWKGALIEGAEDKLRRLEKASDLPPKKVLSAFVKEAMRLNESGAKPPKAPKAKQPMADQPEALVAALAKNKKAREAFAKLPPGHQREYAEWIAGAKREDTRDRRVKTALEWIAGGKSLNWKYQKR